MSSDNVIIGKPVGRWVALDIPQEALEDTLWCEEGLNGYLEEKTWTHKHVGYRSPCDCWKAGIHMAIYKVETGRTFDQPESVTEPQNLKSVEYLCSTCFGLKYDTMQRTIQVSENEEIMTFTEINPKPQNQLDIKSKRKPRHKNHSSVYLFENWTPPNHLDAVFTGSSLRIPLFGMERLSDRRFKPWNQQLEHDLPIRKQKRDHHFPISRQRE